MIAMIAIQELHKLALLFGMIAEWDVARRIQPAGSEQMQWTLRTCTSVNVPLVTNTMIHAKPSPSARAIRMSYVCSNRAFHFEVRIGSPILTFCRLLNES